MIQHMQYIQQSLKQNKSIIKHSCFLKQFCLDTDTLMPLSIQIDWPLQTVQT